MGVIVLGLFFSSLVLLLPRSGSLCAAVEGIVERAEVKQFPGYDGELPSKHYSGYITLADEGFKKHYYYYFATSERDPVEDPVTIFYNGGPGCSGLSAVTRIIGPFRVENNHDFLTVGPKVKLEPYSWTKFTSLLVLDAPMIAPYSFAEKNQNVKIEFEDVVDQDPRSYVTEAANNRVFESSPDFDNTRREVIQIYPTDDTQTVADMYGFLRKWFLVFPEFLPNPFYIAGSSYAGVYVAAVGNEIANGIDAGLEPKINFKGYSLGNAAIDVDIENNARVPYAYHMGFIPEELYKELKETCNGKYRNNNNPDCRKNMEEYDKLVGDIHVNHILCLPCHKNMGLDFLPHEQQTVNLYPTLSNEPEQNIYCYDFEQRTTNLFNPLASRKMINALPEEITGKWVRCPTKILNYTRNLHSLIPYHHSLTMRGYRAFVHTGDHDMLIPPAVNVEWIKRLNYSVVEKWRPWYVDNHIAGYMMQFDHNILFATFKGAGHTVPEYQPREAFIAHQRWFSGSKSI